MQHFSEIQFSESTHPDTALYLAREGQKWEALLNMLFHQFPNELNRLIYESPLCAVFLSFFAFFIFFFTMTRCTSLCLCQDSSIRLNKALSAVWHLFHLWGRGYIPAMAEREKGSMFIRSDSDVIKIVLCMITHILQLIDSRDKNNNNKKKNIS